VPLAEPLASAIAAIEAHDVEGLALALTRAPDIVGRPVGDNENHLLDMAAATCDERTVALLLERGADPAATNVYGWTALHQAAYIGLPPLARLLLDAGAPLDMAARGDGGTPLVVALFWGRRQTAELLAETEPLPRNLRVAAGLDRRELVEELVAPDGALAPGAGAHRAFHRPHSGFPEWTPSDDPQEVLDEALPWAARNDAVAVLEVLVARGARVDADVYRGTALAWAAACGRVAAIERLVALGADVNARTTFGGPDHGEVTTALHLAAQSGHLDAITALLTAGADRTLRDGLHDSTPAGWADHGGQAAAVAALN